MSGDKFADDFYDSSAYTADISTKMRIPEHINAHGSLRNGENNHGDFGKANSALYDMQVPDRSDETEGENCSIERIIVES